MQSVRAVEASEGVAGGAEEGVRYLAGLAAAQNVAEVVAEGAGLPTFVEGVIKIVSQVLGRIAETVRHVENSQVCRTAPDVPNRPEGSVPRCRQVGEGRQLPQITSDDPHHVRTVSQIHRKEQLRRGWLIQHHPSYPQTHQLGICLVTPEGSGQLNQGFLSCPSAVWELDEVLGGGQQGDVVVAEEEGVGTEPYHVGYHVDSIRNIGGQVEGELQEGCVLGNGVDPAGSCGGGGEVDHVGVIDVDLCQGGDQLDLVPNGLALVPEATALEWVGEVELHVVPLFCEGEVVVADSSIDQRLDIADHNCPRRRHKDVHLDCIPDEGLTILIYKSILDCEVERRCPCRYHLDVELEALSVCAGTDGGETAGEEVVVAVGGGNPGDLGRH